MSVGVPAAELGGAADGGAAYGDARPAASRLCGVLPLHKMARASPYSPLETLARRLHIDGGMLSASWMLSQLEFATRTHHMAADASRIALLNGPITRDRYETYLAKVFQFEAPAEARWLKVVGLESVIDLKPRLRAGSLISDLTSLGVRAASPGAAEFVGVEQALGWMYVVERGRRMNALLYRHLVRRLPQQMSIAGNYLNTSSPCGTRWQHFGVALDKFATNHVIVEQIINAAQRAFRSQRSAPRFTPSIAARPAACR